MGCTQGPPKLGAFILPDNGTAGTLEDILLDSAKEVYPKLLESAFLHVDSARYVDLIPDDLKEFNKPAGKNKAIIGTMASILKPGKAIQVSIQDNQWLQGSALSLPRIKAVQNFLANLFELG